jgi:type IV pilus assembly protein PilY1
MKYRIPLQTALLGGLFSLASAQAEDIDLFMGAPPGERIANVLFIFDNTANWDATAQDWSSDACGSNGTKFCYEKEAIATAVAGLSGDKGKGFNLGLMLFPKTNEGVGVDGGYVRFAMRDMGNATNNTSLVELVNSLTSKAVAGSGSDKGDNASFAQAMHEAYLYFKGLNARSGITTIADHLTVKDNQGKDFSPQPDPASLDAFDSGSFSLSGKTGSANYRQPPGPGCNNFVIFLSNGAPSKNDDTPAGKLLADLGGTEAGDPINLEKRYGAGSYSSNWSDEYARFLAANGIKTYTIDVAPKKTGSGPDNTALLQSMADQGRGAYFEADSMDKLVKAIEDIFTQIQSVNSVFASVALPVSVNVRGTHLNQVYMGMFRPDEDKKPRWYGNLKLYQLAADAGGNVFMTDSTGTTRVQSPTTGFMVDSAVSFWTEDNKDLAYWDFSPRFCASASADSVLCGNPPSVSDSPDGAVVEKGGEAQTLRTTFKGDTDSTNTLGNRKLYTCVGCSSGDTLGAFDTSNGDITQALLGAADATERDAIINWVRGVDNAAPAEKTAGGVRPSIHGDVLHSRPVIVNYNRKASDCKDKSNLDKDIVVFYGGNDGILHAVQGGKNDVAEAGRELWGFIPDESLGKFKRLRADDPLITYPSVPSGADNKPYFLDGNLTIYAVDNGSPEKNCRLDPADGDKVYLFATLRRGGPAIYAFDITDPASPKFLWKKTSASSGYSELGQTWSELKPAVLPGGTPVLIFGAGYDPDSEDRAWNESLVPPAYDKPAAASAVKGRGVFVVKAESGEVLRKFGPDDQVGDTDALMSYAVPSDVSVLLGKGETDKDQPYYAWVGDAGGNLWRINFTGDDKKPTSDKAKWRLVRLASLGDPGDADRTKANGRKFLYPPDVVKLDEEDGYAVLLGSGDREHPFETLVQNRYYMIKDDLSSADKPIRCEGDESDCDLFDATDPTKQVPTDSKGWYIKFNTGEKAVGGSVTLNYTTFFTTNQWAPPDPNSCATNLGIARIYGLDYRTAGSLAFSGRSEEIPGGGFPPTPTPAAVELTLPDGTPVTKEVVISGPTVKEPGGAPTGRRRLIYWFKQGLD